MELFYFLWENGSTTTTKYFDMATAIFVEQVFHVFKKFNMAALVRSNCNTLYIFFNCAFHNFMNAAIVSKVNDLCTF